MTQFIEHALGSLYSMYYTDRIEIARFTPVATLDQSLTTVNNGLEKFGSCLLHWPESMQDEIARLVNVKVIYKNLPTAPIRKPILFHSENNKFIVDCGDTRLMALSLLGDPPLVPAITTCLKGAEQQFVHWQEIKNNRDLIKACGFKDHAQILYEKSTVENYAISWLEIGDDTTSALMYHDKQRALDVAQNVIDNKRKLFKFDIAWLQEPT